MINTKFMHDAGLRSRNMTWTDLELEDQIVALELVTSYLEGRQDSGLVKVALMTELESFRRMKAARQSCLTGAH